MTTGLSSSPACALLVALLLLVEGAAAQQPTLLQRLVSFFGLDADPSQMKGPREEFLRGEIWTADLASGTRQRMAAGKSFRSPIYLLNGDILALNGEMLVRISAGRNTASSLHTVKGVDKLVAANANDPGQILLLHRDKDALPVPAILWLKEGLLTPVDVDWRSESDVRGLAHLEGWDRDYEDMRLRVQRMRATRFSGIREWTDVVLLQKGLEPQNVSRCDQVNCGQPSLSFDKAKVVFVKGER